MPTFTSNRQTNTASAFTVPMLPVLPYSTSPAASLNYRFPHNVQLFGLEWEMYGTPSLNSLRGHLGHVQAANRTFIAKQDASVSGGLELVTVPLTLPQQYALLNRVNERYVHQDAHCGIHVHTTASTLSEPQKLAMYTFVHGLNSPQLNAFLTRVAGRGSVGYASRCGVNFIAEPLEVSYRLGHVSAIAPTSKGTVETRIFASTTKVAKVKANLQFVAALVAYTATNNTYEAVSNPAPFIAYVNANEATYPELACLVNHGANALTAQVAEPASEPTSYVAPLAMPTAGEALAAAELAAYQAARRATQRTTATQGVRINVATQNRERRTRSVVPTTAAVIAYLESVSPQAPVELALHIRANRRSFSALAFATWYANHCYNGAVQQQIVTTTGNVVTGTRAIATHAFYHLRLVAHV